MPSCGSGPPLTYRLGAIENRDLAFRNCMKTPFKFRWPRPFADLQGITMADGPREVSIGELRFALVVPLPQ